MMNIQELSKWADQQIFAKTGKHLDSLQKSILEGVFQFQDFSQIKDTNGYSYDHVKKEGAELWKILSDVFEEDIKQCNVKSILENKFLGTINNFDNSAPIIGSYINKNVNICRENQQDRDNKKRRSASSNSQNQSFKINQKDIPVFNYNYGRKTEIDQLKDWLENKTKLITIYGLSGIGKTALILKLIPEIKENFDYIFYRTLDNKPTLINLKDELKQFFAQEKLLPKVIDYFRSSRCLVILDDVHNIFKTGDFSGQYLPEFKDYGRFFQKVASLDHQSCVILISWEKPQQIDQLEANNFNVKSLPLMGLGEDGKEILKEKGLKDQDQYLSLINLYQGNPSWLNLIANIIRDDFNREISQFLALDELCLEGIETTLENHLERLSESEINLINNLADQDQAINIKQQLIKIRKSLIRRCLVEQILQENELKFQLNSIFKAYIQQSYPSRKETIS
jgi:DNA replication protein DnaC